MQSVRNIRENKKPVELNSLEDDIKLAGESLRQEQFSQSPVDFTVNIPNPENKKLYQQVQEEIIKAEKERGIDVTFINPEPGYVIKTSSNGSTKVFINICLNDNIDKPSSIPDVQEGSRGLRWSLPHYLAPPREDIDKKKGLCQVYDVIFHRDTLHLALRNKVIFNTVNTIACDAIESNFDITLDKKNLKFPNLKYKGLLHAVVLKKTSGEKLLVNIDDPSKESISLDKQVDNPSVDSKKPHRNKKPKKSDLNICAYTTPKYVIKHKELQGFKSIEAPEGDTSIPTELVLEVNLPLLKSSTDIFLDVTEKTVQLISEKPVKYKLDLTLPFPVNQDTGNAKFDKDVKKLILMLPIKNIVTPLEITDSGVESDTYAQSTPESDTSIDHMFQVDEQVNILSDSSLQRPCNRANSFLDNTILYVLPEYACETFDGVISFRLNVKNAEDQSIQRIIDQTNAAVHLKFISTDNSYSHVHYAFFVKFPGYRINKESDVSVETWDNSVILEINFQDSIAALKNYYVGIHSDDIVLKNVILNDVCEHKYEGDEEISINHDTQIPTERAQYKITEENEHMEDARGAGFRRNKNAENGLSNVTTDLNETSNRGEREALNIFSMSYESSCDELGCSFSPSKGKGILKRNSRKLFSRSISESSLDDCVCCSSFDYCYSGIDSGVTEDGEFASSPKKTVRFNDVVSRQLFRSNSSILGQKKKNQRKAKNKKKSQTRRTSESDTSEIEEKKEDHDEDEYASSQQDNSLFDEICDNDIFQIDV